MAEMCNDCGLPQELCVCTDMDRSDSPEVTITVEDRRFDKQMTVIEGLARDDVDELSSKLKSAVAAGGTQDEDEGRVLLQGNHAERDEVHSILEDKGYKIVN